MLKKIPVYSINSSEISSGGYNEITLSLQFTPSEKCGKACVITMVL